jgi:hypothetical protein
MPKKDVLPFIWSAFLIALLIMCIATIIWAAVVFIADRAGAHDWYPDDCCHSADQNGDHGECHPIPSCDEITPFEYGLKWRGHEFTGGQIRKSKDTKCHVCSTPSQDGNGNIFPDDHPHCIFVYEKPDS